MLCPWICQLPFTCPCFRLLFHMFEGILSIFDKSSASFQVLSDLHLEVYQQYLSFEIPVCAKYLILASDVGRLVDYIAVSYKSRQTDSSLSFWYLATMSSTVTPLQQDYRGLGSLRRNIVWTGALSSSTRDVMTFPDPMSLSLAVHSGLEFRMKQGTLFVREYKTSKKFSIGPLTITMDLMRRTLPGC